MSWQPAGPGDGGVIGGQPREFRADFDTPEKVLERTSIDRRPDAITLDYLTAFALGPVALSDPTQRTINRPWAARVNGTAIEIARSSHSAAELVNGHAAGAYWEEWQELFTFDPDDGEVLEIDLGFDQNGSAYIVAERAPGEVWLYWPNPQAGGAFVFEKIADGHSPRILLDDPENSQESDVLVFYVDADGVKWLAQREVFATPYLIPNAGWTTLDMETVTADPANVRLQDVALTGARRLLVIADEHDPASGTYRILLRESAPYPLYLPQEAVEQNVALVRLLAEKVANTYTPEAEAVGQDVRLHTLFAEELVIEHNLQSEAVDQNLTLAEFYAEEITIQYEPEPEAVDQNVTLFEFLAELYQITYSSATPEAVDLSVRLNSFVTEEV